MTGCQQLIIYGISGNFIIKMPVDSECCPASDSLFVFAEVSDDKKAGQNNEVENG